MIITIHKNNLPAQLIRPGGTIQQKNRVQCRKSFNGFPKEQYSNFYVQVARIVRLLKKLNDLWLEGRAIIQLENGIYSEVGCLWIYRLNTQDTPVKRDADYRLREIKAHLSKFTRQFTHGYKVIFKLYQWIDPVR